MVSPPPNSNIPQKKSFVWCLWRIVFPMLFGPGDGLLGEGGGGTARGGGGGGQYPSNAGGPHGRLGPPCPRGRRSLSMAMQVGPPAHKVPSQGSAKSPKGGGDQKGDMELPVRTSGVTHFGHVLWGRGRGKGSSNKRGGLGGAVERKGQNWLVDLQERTRGPPQHFSRRAGSMTPGIWTSNARGRANHLITWCRGKFPLCGHCASVALRTCHLLNTTLWFQCRGCCQTKASSQYLFHNLCPVLAAQSVAVPL